MTAIKPLRDMEYDPAEPVKLTICSIAFNHGAYIRECLEGFLDQRCDFRVEIIVHDDASTDDTAAILREYAERYPSIVRLILQEKNVYSTGVNPYYAYVFPAAEGDYLAICDGDDYWDDPDKLVTQVSFLERNADVSLTYGRVKAVRETGVEHDFRNGLERDLTAQELKLGLPINTLTRCFRNIFGQAHPPFYARRQWEI
ncbi:glycosyltransferase family 2 protein [Roseovarius sp. 2305UL8-3]|uniref:glycosyltransferase family 2 protein n=1 Tax=Roseovarius conchicola TaxID=3121636 RepID=UPI003527BF85